MEFPGASGARDRQTLEHLAHQQPFFRQQPQKKGQIFPLPAQGPVPPEQAGDHPVLPAVLWADLCLLLRPAPSEKEESAHRHHLHLSPQAGLEGAALPVVRPPGRVQQSARSDRLLFQRRAVLLRAAVGCTAGEVRLCAARHRGSGALFGNAASARPAVRPLGRQKQPGL